MSVSTLESLPNEILADILENYFTGIDILNTFAFQLNQRFEALIIQSKGLCFNFIRCHKDDFRLCMGLFPAYADTIQNLALAEEYTPGQINAFLSLYPSFGVFKHLRKLYLQIDVKARKAKLLEDALRSLWTTNLHTLCLKITGTRAFSPFNDLIIGMFRIKTLKKLFLHCDMKRMNWEPLKGITSNIEHLTLNRSGCDLESFETILRVAPALRYLNIDINLRSVSDREESTLLGRDTPPQMLALRTIIFHVHGFGIQKVAELGAHLKCMPSLCRLQFELGYTITNIRSWAIFIKTLASSVTSLTLELKTSNLSNRKISYIQAATDIPFWITKKQFNIIVRQETASFIQDTSSTIPEDRDENRWINTIDRWYIGPTRTLENNSSILNRISKLCLSTDSPSFVQNYYLNNVTHLVMKNLNNDFLALLMTHVNCLKIKHLHLGCISKKDNLISSLLSLASNVESLRIRLEQLCGTRCDHPRQHHSVQLLDLSIAIHSFNEKDISIISRMFPHLEHLLICTEDLKYVPLLQSYLPRLRSLSYIDLRSNQIESFEYITQRSRRSRLERKGKCFTIWLDQAAYKDECWSTCI